MSDINSIKSRLGSLSPTAMAKLPAAVQKLLTEDMPWLISMYEEEKERPEYDMFGNGDHD